MAAAKLGLKDQLGNTRKFRRQVFSIQPQAVPGYNKKLLDDFENRKMEDAEKQFSTM